MLQIILILIAAALQPGGGSGTADQAGSADITMPAPQPASKLVAEPQIPTGKFTTATEVKPILTATKANWVAVREFNGQDLVYVTQILSWRCGLLELKVGLNGAVPEPWPLPACHMDQPMPSVLLDTDGLPYRAFAPGSVQRVEVQLTYDDLSSDGAVFERAAVLMP